MKLKIHLKVLNLVKLNIPDSVYHTILTLKQRTKARKWKRENYSVIQLQNEEGSEVRVSSCSTYLHIYLLRYTTILSNICDLW